MKVCIVVKGEKFQIKLKTHKYQDTQTNIQANPSIFHVQRSRVQTRQNREHIK